jgi:hypothetical protein
MSDDHYFDIVIGVDGTGTREFLVPGFRMNDGRPFTNSSVFRFLEECDAEAVHYLHGPDDLGFKVNTIIDRVQDLLSSSILQAFRVGRRERIWFVGTSRGAHILVVLATRINLAARRLEKNLRLSAIAGSQVHFLGAFDAVDRTLSKTNSATVPPNVSHMRHARRDPLYRSQPAFGSTATNAVGRDVYREKFFAASHSGLGGDANNQSSADQRRFANEVAKYHPGVSPSQFDIDNSEAAYQWMKSEAQLLGLRFCERRRFLV